jgi:hypothetical protein
MVAVSVGALAGCRMACTEVGWSNSLEVVAAGGGASAAVSIEACFDDRCVTSADPSVEYSDVRVDDAGEGVWIVYFGVASPGEVTISARDASGDVIGEKQHKIQWAGTWEPNGAGCSNGSVASPTSLDTRVA